MAPADGAGGDNFAWSSGVSGDTAVLTAYLDDDNNDLDSGSAYIFERNQGGPDDWGQVKKILPPDGTAGDQFGYAAAVDGDNVVVGAYLNADLGFWAGAAYIFERGQGGANNWGLVKKLYAADGAPYDNFGRAVAIQGDTIAIGAIRDNDNGNNSGSVYLFGRN